MYRNDSDKHQNVSGLIWCISCIEGAAGGTADSGTGCMRHNLGGGGEYLRRHSMDPHPTSGGRGEYMTISTLAVGQGTSGPVPSGQLLLLDSHSSILSPSRAAFLTGYLLGKNANDRTIKPSNRATSF